MLLKLLTWNINFIYDNWTQRLTNINNVLQKEINDCDILALQEAVLPFSDTVHNIYQFLKAPIVNHVQHRLFSEEENYIYSEIKKQFPKTKLVMVKIFEFLMDKLLLICGYIFSKYGEFLKNIYFTYPFVCLILVLLCPIIFIGQYFFIGMITIINKNINSSIKTKFLARPYQYAEFKYNNRNIIAVNIHLNYSNQKTKRMNEIRNIYDFVETKKKDIIILMGDFNSEPSSEVYAFLKEQKFISVINKIHGEDINTWPSKYPNRCIDYIWIKGGDLVKVKSAKILKYPEATDHLGIKAVIDIL